MARVPAQDWLRSRVDRSALDAVERFLATTADHLATATSDAVTIRRLSSDGDTLVPVAAHHPDPERGAAMLAIMWQTTDAHTGLWRPVVEQRSAVRWRVPPGTAPADASPDQAEFVHEHAIRAVLGVPLVWDDEVVGGVSLVRFSVDREFTDDDVALVEEVAPRIAGALHLRTVLRARVVSDVVPAGLTD